MDPTGLLPEKLSSWLMEATVVCPLQLSLLLSLPFLSSLSVGNSQPQSLPHSFPSGWPSTHWPSTLVPNPDSDSDVITQFQTHSACVHVLSCFSCVWIFATSWTVARQAPPSTGFFRQEYWSGLPPPTLENLPDPGIKLASPALAGRFYNTGPLYNTVPNPQHPLPIW